MGLGKCRLFFAESGKILFYLLATVMVSVTTTDVALSLHGNDACRVSIAEQFSAEIIEFTCTEAH